ncbi:MAG: AgmX/PglI C-terminal domain-containing protein [Labilithrix sp.]|nr:AgmX/PglI C-terminal domain-containing protein [Labilithrix sp.]
MSRSPYRRGVPVLLIGAAIVAVTTGALGWVSTVPRPTPREREAFAPYAPPPPDDPFGIGALVNPPRRPPEMIQIPVETTPPGASVHRLDRGFHARLCAPTPCEITVDRNDLDGMVVSLELPGYASGQAHVKDVADVPGGTLMLDFGPRTSASPPAPRSFPKLRQGSMQVSGGLPPEVIQRIVRQNFGRFRLCYEKGLGARADLRGRVATKITIDASGAVASAVDAGSDLPDASTVSCVVRAFDSLSFPQPEGGSVTVVYPIIFDPAE